MIDENKYCIDVIKELVMTKKDHEDFKNSPKCQVCDNEHTDCDVKVRDRFSSIMKEVELGKFNFKINGFLPNRLENYMGFNTNNKLAFNDSLKFLI